MQRLLRTGRVAAAFSVVSSNSSLSVPKRYNANSAVAEAEHSYPIANIVNGHLELTNVPDDSAIRVPAKPREPFTKVGNILIIKCTDYPFKYSWEVCRMLRDLRLEFRGQIAIFPDIPSVRLRLWRCRHVVSVDMISTDGLKKMLGVPQHISFADLRKQLPSHLGDSRRGAGNPYLRSRVDFMSYRRERMRDIMHRDQQELALLAEKKRLRSLQNEATQKA